MDALQNTSSNSIQSEPEIPELSDDKPVWYSYSDIIEEADQSELASIRTMLKWSYFRIGDIALKYVQGNARKNALRVPADRIYEAIGYFVGRTARTVRYYAENAAFFPEDVRDTYKVLPFSYFDLSRTFGDQWREVLEYATENINMSYDSIEYNCRQAFMHNEPIYTPHQESDEIIESLEKLSEKIPMCESPTKAISGPSRAQLLSLTNAASDLVEKINRLDRAIGLPEDIHIQLSESLDGIRRVIESVSGLLDEMV